MNLLVTTEQAAELADVDVTTIRRWARKGWLTPHGSPKHRTWEVRQLAFIHKRQEASRRAKAAARPLAHEIIMRHTGIGA